MVKRKEFVLSPDASEDNADWTKKTWDIPAHNIEELRRYLESTRITPEAFRELPVYKWNVEKMPWLKDL